MSDQHASLCSYIRYTRIVSLALLCLIPFVAYAGSLDSSATPGTTQFYTLEDLYQRLKTGATGTQSVFAEPVAGYTVGTMHTINDIMGKAPSVDDTNGAMVAQALSGKRFWGLRTGAWGVFSGTMVNVGPQNIAPGTSAQTITQGYHNGTGQVDGDADLVTGNIRSGVSLFGVNGKTEVVDTTEASNPVSVGRMRTGDVAFVNGSKVTGTGTKTLSASSTTVAEGYYAGTDLVTVDADLVTGNIKSGVTLFGINGKTQVVDTTEATNPVTAGRMKTGDVAFVNSSKITGTGTQTLSASSTTVSEGYYAATSLSTVDGDLAAGNIKKDVNVFGVVGNYNGLAKVPKTGQTVSYAADDDGALEKGVAWPSPRFTDNGDGTVTDNLTSLVWLKKANYIGVDYPGFDNDDTAGDGRILWQHALDFVAAMNAGTYANLGHTDWRLPNIRELSSLADDSCNNPALPSGHPFTDIVNTYYWSGTTQAFPPPTVAWLVYMPTSRVDTGSKTVVTAYVWPVRGGD